MSSPQEPDYAEAGGRRGPGLGRLFLIVGSLLVTLGALETAARLSGDPPRAPLITDRRPEWSQLYRSDRTLFWTLVPGNHRVERPVSPSGTVQINPLGLRGPEPRPDFSGTTVLSLGESTTFGSGVEQASTYSARLESELQARCGRGRVRVVNAGVPGYSSVQGLELLRRLESRLEPALVLTYFGHNDLLGRSFSLQRDGSAGPRAASDLEELRRREEWPGRIDWVLRNRTHLYGWWDRRRTAGLPAAFGRDAGHPRVSGDERREVWKPSSVGLAKVSSSGSP